MRVGGGGGGGGRGADRVIDFIIQSVNKFVIPTLFKKVKGIL